MGRRKSRRKVSTRPRKTIPKVFQCPRCGALSVNVSINKQDNKAHVVCSSCDLVGEFEYKEYYHPVDYYAKFLDLYEENARSSAESTAVNRV